MKPSVSLILYKAKKKKDGGYPVKVRVIYQRNYHDYKTEFSLTEEVYNAALAPSIKKAYKELNSELIELKNRAIKIVKNLKPFTFEKFKIEYYGKIRDASDLFSIFDAYVASLEKEGRLKTAISYRSAKISLQKFKPKISLFDINPAFLKKYEREMLSQGKSITTIGIYLRSLRTIYNCAINDGIIKRDENYPFVKKKYAIPASRNIKKALNEIQLSALIKYKAIPGTREDWARDMWLFSYYCSGINFKDIALLKVKNIDGDMLRFVREKTRQTTIGSQSPISCAINDKVSQILKKWAKPDGAKDDYLFNILDKEDDAIMIMKKVAQFIKLTNKYVKQIAEKINLGIIPTTYHARHSFATQLIKSGVPIEVVQEQFGHTTVKTTKSYFAGFGDEVRREIAAKLTDFL